jgi:hypothetical protein
VFSLVQTKPVSLVKLKAILLKYTVDFAAAAAAASAATAPAAAQDK